MPIELIHIASWCTYAYQCLLGAIPLRAELGDQINTFIMYLDMFTTDKIKLSL